MGIFYYFFLTLLIELPVIMVFFRKQWKEALLIGILVNAFTWPLLQLTLSFVNDQWIPDILSDTAHWKRNSFLLYDQSGLIPTLVQVIHRNLAYLISIFVMLFCYGWIKNQNSQLHWVAYTLLGIIVAQVLLGIMTLLGSHGSIPVMYGVLHQAGGILALTFLFYIKIRIKDNYISI